ncbi:hypothetical protein GCM10027028_47280 [Streptomyces sundarbansensis]
MTTGLDSLRAMGSSLALQRLRIAIGNGIRFRSGEVTRADRSAFPGPAHPLTGHLSGLTGHLSGTRTPFTHRPCGTRAPRRGPPTLLTRKPVRILAPPGQPLTYARSNYAPSVAKSLTTRRGVCDSR